MIVKIFWQKDCPKCPSAKELGKILEKDGVAIEYHDLQSMDGLAEASFYDVLSTPSIVITNDNKEVAAWRGETPKLDEIKKFL